MISGMTAVSPDFWATTAQVIPALLLAYVLEDRYTTPSESAPRSVATLFVAPTIGLGLTGEFLALRGLLGDGGPWSARLIIGAIGLLSCLIVGAFVWGYAPANLPGEPASRDAGLPRRLHLSDPIKFGRLI
jgi:hypothetical protein